MYSWPVVPLCERQLRDVDPRDILNKGLYRRCDIYKGGGGYDRFATVYRKRNNVSEDVCLNNQFVVQLYGCPLRCPYCYVTNDGVFGKSVPIPTEKIVSDFLESKLDVFHLMGGAPALYIDYWSGVLERLNGEKPFHSDFLLVEGEYKDSTLKALSGYSHQLHAVSVKGSTDEEFFKNTGVRFNQRLFWNNLTKLLEHNIPFYITYTGMNDASISTFVDKLSKAFPRDFNKILEDSFAINLVKYKALD